MRYERLRLTAAFLLGAVGLHVALLAVRAFFDWSDSTYFPLARLFAGMVSWLVLGLGGALSVWVYVLLHAGAAQAPPACAIPPGRTPFRRTARYVLVSFFVLSWALTAFLGVPAVITSLVSRSVSGYKYFAVRQPLLLSAPFPRLEASVAVPILPGLILVSYGAQLAGQAGGGGWGLHAWWGTGTRELYYWPRWMS